MISMQKSFKNLIVIFLFPFMVYGEEHCPIVLDPLSNSYLENVMNAFKKENPKGVLEKYFNALPPCEAKEFLDGNVTGAWGTTMGIIPVEIISLTAKEVVRPLRSNKVYFGSANYPVFGKNAHRLAQELLRNEISSIEWHLLADAATKRYENAKKNGEIGECFSIETLGGYKYLFSEKKDSISVSAKVMNEIDSLFNNKRNSALPLSQEEKNLLLNKTLTLEEIYELRSIRKATEIFEKNTVLKYDKAGGFFSNISGEVRGDFQQNCSTEASTYIRFLEVLRNRGLLKHFKVFSRITIHPEFKKDPSRGGHVAVRMNTRKGKAFILDSWFEPGGSAAHILSLEEWKKLSLAKKNDFKDVVKILP